MKKTIFSFMGIFLFCTYAGATVYYIDGSNGLDTNPGTLQLPWQSIDKANDILIAGDTVYIRGGTYNVEKYGINPSNSGTKGAFITYSAYNDEVVIFSGTNPTSRAVNLDGKNYIKITKLIFENMGTFLWIIGGGSYNEISYCTFRNAFAQWGYTLTSGTVTENHPSVAVHNDDGSSLNTWNYRRLWNVTDGSACTTGSREHFSITGIPSLNETFIVDTQIFTWKTGRSNVGEVTIGSDVNQCAINAAAAINADLTTVNATSGLYRSEGRIYLTQAVEGSGNKTLSSSTANMTVSGSGFLPSAASTNTQIACSSAYPLWGGKTNTWSVGDKYRVTFTYVWGGSYIYQNATHNWIHHCVFHNYGAYSWNDEGVILELGVGLTSSTDRSDNNTLENNEFFAGGHHVLGVNTGQHQVIRHNYIHNEAWWNDKGYWNDTKCESFENHKCGYRVVSGVANKDSGGKSLWENNRIAYGAQYGGPDLRDAGAGSGQTLATSNNIVRYNEYFGNALYGMRFAAAIGGSVSNRVYNNTFFKNGYGADDNQPWAQSIYRGGMLLTGTNCNSGEETIIKNNLFYHHWITSNTAYPVIYWLNADETCFNVSNNFDADDIDPLFTNPDITNPASSNLPDLSLQKGSPAINDGTHLTYAIGQGTDKTEIVVADASYFQDGTWGSDLARSSLHPDWIAIGTIYNEVQISSIDYTTNTITLASPKSWNDKDNIWLLKKSDGNQVVFGTGADMGANELDYVSPPPTSQLH